MYLWHNNLKFKKLIMNHKHFDQIPSTHSELLKLVADPSKEILISCEHQTSGRGQYSRTWDTYKHSLCFSFNLKKCPTTTLTSLEVGVHLLNYFKSIYNIELNIKWPNDLLNLDDQKVGGILIQSFRDDEFAVGIGLNFFPTKFSPDYRTPAGSIFKKDFSWVKKEEAVKIYNYILSRRLPVDEIIPSWNTKCAHLNREILFVEDDIEYRGIFKGLGDHGQAQLEINNQLKEFYSGSIILT